jgi:hypothetical protein
MVHLRVLTMVVIRATHTQVSVNVDKLYRPCQCQFPGFDIALLLILILQGHPGLPCRFLYTSSESMLSLK